MEDFNMLHNYACSTEETLNSETFASELFENVQENDIVYSSELIIMSITQWS